MQSRTASRLLTSWPTTCDKSSEDIPSQPVAGFFISLIIGHKMDTKSLEKYFETVVLPLYGDAVGVTGITWKDHGKVGPDSWAHHFDDQNGREYVLLYEDFPGSDYLADDLSHELVPCGDEQHVRVNTEPEADIANMTGYFTLYAEKKRS
jgi:hypothetical protein